jgi:hypothetical protein
MFLKNEKCPNCGHFKLYLWSPARMALYCTVAGILVVCVPVIGWLLAIVILPAEIVLTIATIVLYMVPAMRRITLKCWHCKWQSAPEPATA